MSETAPLSFFLFQNEQYIPNQVCSDTQGAGERQYRLFSDQATNILEFEKSFFLMKCSTINRPFASVAFIAATDPLLETKMFSVLALKSLHQLKIRMGQRKRKLL